jgi:hypothetical protein
MSAKNKNKADDNDVSVTKTAGRVIPVITVFYAIEQAEQIIKIKKPKSFSDNRKAFSEYVTSIRLFI